MNKKISRNDPCPCGSGKKFKVCCLKKTGSGKKPFKATLLSGEGLKKETVNLMERTFGEALSQAKNEKTPPLPPQGEIENK